MTLGVVNGGITPDAFTRATWAEPENKEECLWRELELDVWMGEAASLRRRKMKKKENWKTQKDWKDPSSSKKRKSRAECETWSG